MSVRRSRKRDVDRSQAHRDFFLGADFFFALVDRCGNGVARFVEQLTDDRAFLFGERFHPLAPFGDAAAFAEIFYPDCLRAISRRAQLQSRAARHRAVVRAGA